MGGRGRGGGGGRLMFIHAFSVTGTVTTFMGFLKNMFQEIKL